MKKRIVTLLLALCLLLSLCACAGQTAQTGSQPASTAEPKILKLAASFAYPRLDVHKEYYGWYTSIYGVSEALFRVGDDLSVQPAGLWHAGAAFCRFHI